MFQLLRARLHERVESFTYPDSVRQQPFEMVPWDKFRKMLLDEHEAWPMNCSA
jgi:hypothetical protein